MTGDVGQLTDTPLAHLRQVKGSVSHDNTSSTASQIQYYSNQSNHDQNLLNLHKVNEFENIVVEFRKLH